jgi:Concanavalin A-like lectin/glucanases superfamily
MKRKSVRQLYLWSLRTLALLTLVTAAHADLSTGLVAYYPFNGSPNDASGNGNNGTVVGATFATDTPNNRTGLLCNGTSATYVVVPRSASLEPTDAISISLWCKGVPGAANTYGTILRKAGNLQPGYFLRKFLHDDVDVTPTFLIDSGGDSWCAFSPSDGTSWRHLVATYSRTDGLMRTYVNGVEINSTVLSQQLLHSGDLFIGGATVHSQDGGFNGLINEIRIYNRVLSESEIQELGGSIEALNQASICLGPTGSCALSGVSCILALATGGGSIPATVAASISLENSACNFATNPDAVNGMSLAISLTAFFEGIPCVGVLTSCTELLVDAYNQGPNCGGGIITTCLQGDLTSGALPASQKLFAVSTLSPVDIEVVDANGNRMLVDGSGSVSSSISQGWIYKFGQHNQLALVTDPVSAFTVLIHGAESAGAGSTFTLGLLLPPANGGTYNSIDFTGVPTRFGAVAKVVVNVDSNTTNYTLAIDLDGDGTFETSACHSSVNGQSSPPCDSDGDGIPDALDQCPNTLPGSIVNANGCSIAQLVPCAGPRSGGKWKTHGDYVSAIANAANQFLAAGLITQAQKDGIVTQAGASTCGGKK